MSTEERWPDFLEVMGALGEKLDRIIANATEKTLPDNVQGIAISDTAATVVLHEGYRYNYLVIGTDAGKAMGPVGTLTIATPAISYAVPVSQGINVLNVKGSSAKLSIAGLTGSYACQFVETNDLPVANFETVSLQGTEVNGEPILGNVQLIYQGDIAFIGTLGDSDTLYGGLQALPVGSYGLLFDVSTDHWARSRAVSNTNGVPASATSGLTPAYITTATTTVIKASAGVVGTLSNASGAATGSVTIYDSTSASGNVVWSGTLASGQVLSLGFPCAAGITVVTAAADAIALTYA